MRIKVRLLGVLAVHAGACDQPAMLELDVGEGTTCNDVAAGLDLPVGGAVMFSVAGVLKRPDEVVHDGDEIQMFKPLAGG